MPQNNNPLAEDIANLTVPTASSIYMRAQQLKQPRIDEIARLKAKAQQLRSDLFEAAVTMRAACMPEEAPGTKAESPRQTLRRYISER